MLCQDRPETGDAGYACLCVECRAEFVAIDDIAPIRTNLLRDGFSRVLQPSAVDIGDLAAGCDEEIADAAFHVMSRKAVWQTIAAQLRLEELEVA